MLKTSIIMYDFDRIKNGKLEFKNLANPDERRQLDLRLMDMQDTIRSLEAAFGGEILLIKTYVRDECNNQVLIAQQPIALEVPYRLTSREIDYINEIDAGLIVVM